MSFWRGERLVAVGPKLIQPFNPSQVDCNAYSLCMGDRYFRTEDEESEKLPEKIFLSSGQLFQIPPGQFAFLLSEEIVNVPEDAMAFISMRLGTKLNGLINVSGFNVDPGYKGKLLFAVYNAGPAAIPVTRGDQIFKIWFCDLDDVSAMVKSPSDGIFDIDSNLIRGMNKSILSLQSLAEKLRDQAHVVDQKFSEQKPVIDNLSFVWRYLQLAVIALALVSGITFAAPILWRLGTALAERAVPNSSGVTPRPNGSQPAAIPAPASTPTPTVTPPGANGPRPGGTGP